MKKNKYIWHCPDCKGTVLLKTEKPYLGEGEVKCTTCKTIFDFWYVTKANKNNIKRYLDLLEKVINK